MSSTRAAAKASISELGLEGYRALAEFRYQIRCFLSFSEQAAREHGVEPQQHQLLLALKGLPEDRRPTIGTIAERLCVKHHTAVTLADRLERAGLVERTRGDRDRREVLLKITERGQELLFCLSALHCEQLSTVGPKLQRALAGIVASLG